MHLYADLVVTFEAVLRISCAVCSEDGHLHIVGAGAVM